MTKSNESDYSSDNDEHPHNESSETSSVPNFSFLAFLKRMADPRNTSDNARIWQTTKHAGNSRSLDHLHEIPDFIKRHIQKLSQIPYDNAESMTTKITLWTHELLPYFNEFIGKDGKIIDDVFQLSPIRLTTSDEDKINQLWAAFWVWIVQCVTDPNKSHNHNFKQFIATTIDDPENPNYEAVSITTFFKDVVSNNITLIPPSAETKFKCSLTIEPFEHRINLDEELTYNTAFEQFSTLRVAKNTALTNVKDEIIRLASKLKNEGYSIQTLSTVLLTAGQTLFQLNHNDGSITLGKLNKAPRELLELASTLIEDTKGLNANIAREGKYKLAGILLGLAGLAIATVSITLAVATCGISTPLSLLGLHVGVSMIGCSVSVFTGTLALGSVGFSLFGAYRGHQKQKDAKEKLSQIESPIKQLSESLTQLADVAQQRVNALRN